MSFRTIHKRVLKSNGT